MDIVFSNEGVLSLVDITTMGDSSKRNDPTKIGEFDSGLKYAMAILYRNGIEAVIVSGGKEYVFGTEVISPDHKAKEVLTVNGVPTAFSPQLGHNWELWMAYRELYSNCIDEGGMVAFMPPGELFGASNDYTHITIKDNDFNVEMSSNWSKYFIVDKDHVYESEGVKVYKNDTEDQHLKLYKNGILIYEDPEKKSQFIYDCKTASIDERRILNDLYSFRNKISSCWSYCNNPSIINLFLDNKIDKSFESSLDYYWDFSDEWVSVINEKHLVEPVTSNNIYRSIFLKIIENSRFNIGYTRVSHSPSSWYSEKATVEIINNNTKEVELSFEDKIKDLCKPFEIKYPIVMSNIEGYKCLPDKSKKILYVAEDFRVEDLWQLVKAVFRIMSNDNADYSYKMFVKLLLR